jgi:hypothetical protein
VTETINALAGLSTSELARLDRFAATFDRLDAASYATLAEAGSGPELEAAKARATALLRNARRKAAVRAAVARFVDAATTAYSRRFAMPDTILLFQSLADRAEDRVRFLQSTERAVVALILWDELAEDDRDLLLGPWGAMVEGSAPG